MGQFVRVFSIGAAVTRLARVKSRPWWVSALVGVVCAIGMLAISGGLRRADAETAAEFRNTKQVFTLQEDGTEPLLKRVDGSFYTVRENSRGVEYEYTTADPADGSVVKVEFLVNGAVAATDLSAPWSVVVNFPTASAATLVARATDNVGGVALSAPVSLTVNATPAAPEPAAVASAPQEGVPVPWAVGAARLTGRTWWPR